MQNICASAVEVAGRWYLESGIRSENGGIARYYRCDIGQNARVSTEITGYTVSTYVYLYGITADPSFQEAAHRETAFLTGDAWDRRASLFPFEYSRNGDRPQPLAYFFDSGIIARSLLSIWRADGHREHLEMAVACARSMLRDFYCEGGFHPVLTLPEKKPLYGEGWSRNGGCYQLKSALAWLELQATKGCAEFRSHYERSLEHSLRTHSTFLPGDARIEKVMDRLHAFCYFLEGLLPYASEPECARALDAGIARVSSYVEEISPVFERSDVLAQLLRLRLYADSLGIRALDWEAAREEAGRIADYQQRSREPRIDGGFLFGRRGTESMPFINPVSTAFCLQALEMWRQYEEGEFNPDWETLI